MLPLLLMAQCGRMPNSCELDFAIFPTRSSFETGRNDRLLCGITGTSRADAGPNPAGCWRAFTGRIRRGSGIHGGYRQQRLLIRLCPPSGRRAHRHFACCQQRSSSALTHAPDLNLCSLQGNVLPASRPTLPLSCLSSCLLAFPSASCHGLIGRASRCLISSLGPTVTNHTTLDMNSVLTVKASHSRAYCSHSLLMLLRCMPYRPVQGESAGLNSMFWIVAAVKYCDFFMTSTLQAIGRSKLTVPI